MQRWRCRLFTEIGASTLLRFELLFQWLAIRSFRHGSEEWRTGRDCVSDASAKLRPISSTGQGGIACAALRPSQDGSRCSLDVIGRYSSRCFQTRSSASLRKGFLTLPKTPRPHPREREWGRGGQGGIRTLGDVTATHAFQACSFDHSDTCPWEAGN